MAEKLAKQKLGLRKQYASDSREIRKAETRLDKIKNIKSWKILQNVIKNENLASLLF